MEELPDALKELADIQAMELSDSRWNYDTSKLIAGIVELALQEDTRLLSSQRDLVPPYRGLKWVFGLLLFVAATFGGLWLVATLKHRNKPADTTRASEASPTESYSIPLDRRAVAIPLVFEYGRPRNYAGVSVIAGDIQFGVLYASMQRSTLASLLERYCGESGALYAQQLKPYVARVSRHDAELVSDGPFLNLLRKSGGEDPVMVRIEDQLFSKFWIDPANAEAKRIGIKTPLGISVVFDTILQGGQGGYEKIKVKTIEKMDGTPATDIPEQEWIAQFLQVRRTYLENFPITGARQSVYRPDFYLALVHDGNWDLKVPIRFRNVVITD